MVFYSKFFGIMMIIFAISAIPLIANLQEFKILNLLAASVVFVIAFSIQKKKNLKSKKYTFIVVLSGLLTFNPGLLVGLVPLAYLSTVKVHRE